MAYINPRLRNPAEGSAMAPIKTGPDWCEIAAAVGAIISFALAAATVALLYLEWDLCTKFIGQ
jgi:hypothetical protein